MTTGAKVEAFITSFTERSKRHTQFVVADSILSRRVPNVTQVNSSHAIKM